MDPLNAAIADQRRYYAARATEYDEAYDGEPAWRVEMAQMEAAFDRVDIRGDVIELAAGTGVWTERIVGRAASLTVVDASTEMLAELRRRLGADAGAVVYDVADLFAWQPSRKWDVCVFAFWLAKVPDARLRAFLDAVARALRPGGTVCCVDKTAAAEPATEFETRTLNDGRQFTIIDHPRTPERIRDAFAAAGMRVTVQTFGPRFSLTVGSRG